MSTFIDTVVEVKDVSETPETVKAGKLPVEPENDVVIGLFQQRLLIEKTRSKISKEEGGEAHA